MELQNRDLGGPGGGKADGGQRVLELLAREPGSETLLGLPNADEIERPVTDSAVMAELAWSAPAIHDQAMGLVIGPGQLFNIPGEPRDEHDGHESLPTAEPGSGDTSRRRAILHQPDGSAPGADSHAAVP
jgi:hypothetical protein